MPVCGSFLVTSCIPAPGTSVTKKLKSSLDHEPKKDLPNAAMKWNSLHLELESAKFLFFDGMVAVLSGTRSVKPTQTIKSFARCVPSPRLRIKAPPPLNLLRILSVSLVVPSGRLLYYAKNTALSLLRLEISCRPFSTTIIAFDCTHSQN